MARTQSSITPRKNQGRQGNNQARGGARGRATRTGAAGRNPEEGAYQGSRQGSQQSSYYGEEEGVTHDTRTAKVIELVAGSPDSFEDAIRTALEDARETLHNIQGCDVRNFTVKCEDGEIVEFRVNLKLAFGIER